MYVRNPVLIMIKVKLKKKKNSIRKSWRAQSPLYDGIRISLIGLYGQKIWKFPWSGRSKTVAKGNWTRVHGAAIHDPTGDLTAG